MIPTNGKTPLECIFFSSSSIVRFDSFAPVRSGRAKWFVDGCDYLASVAEAIDKVFLLFIKFLLGESS